MGDVTVLTPTHAEIMLILGNIQCMFFNSGYRQFVCMWGGEGGKGCY